MPTISGTTKDSSGSFVSRLVRVYRRDNGSFVGKAVSNASTGAWSITTDDTSEHFAIEHNGAINTYFDKLGLGLHFNGINGSQVFPDIAGNIVTAIGNAQISTTESVYGGASGLFDGAGSGLSIPDAAILRPGSGDFSLRFRQRYVSLAGYQTIVSKGYGVTGGLVVQTGNGDGKINVYQGVSSTLVVSESGSTVNTGTWYWVEIERTSGVLTIRRNETTYGSASNSTNFNATSAMYIGGGSSTGFNNFYYNGYLDELELYCGESPVPHTTPGAEFIGEVSGGTENGQIYDRLVPA